MEKLLTVFDLIRASCTRELRHLSLIVAALVAVGLLLALAATYPALAPFLYAVF
jgi:hypothetical protein